MTKKQAIRKVITERKKQKLSMLKASQQGGIAQSSWWEIENGTPVSYTHLTLPTNREV